MDSPRKKIVLPKGYGKKKAGRKKKIIFGSVLEDSIFNIVVLHNQKYPKNKIELDIARRVVKRGLDLGDMNTGLLRLRNFLSKMTGDKNSRYTDDDDLL